MIKKRGYSKINLQCWFDKVELASIMRKFRQDFNLPFVTKSLVVEYYLNVAFQKIPNNLRFNSLEEAEEYLQESTLIRSLDTFDPIHIGPLIGPISPPLRTTVEIQKEEIEEAKKLLKEKLGDLYED